MASTVASVLTHSNDIAINRNRGKDSFVNMTCTLKNALDPNSGWWCTFGLCAMHYCRLYCCKFGVELWSGTFPVCHRSMTWVIGMNPSVCNLAGFMQLKRQDIGGIVHRV